MVSVRAGPRPRVLGVQPRGPGAGYSGVRGYWVPDGQPLKVARGIFDPSAIHLRAQCGTFLGNSRPSRSLRQCSLASLRRSVSIPAHVTPGSPSLMMPHSASQERRTPPGPAEANSALSSTRLALADAPRYPAGAITALRTWRRSPLKTLCLHDAALPLAKRPEMAPTVH